MSFWPLTSSFSCERDFNFIILGYGHIAPSDESGQLTLVLYTILGLPMMMVFLANIGGAMAKGGISDF